jgi:hypothetical protein
MGPDDTDLFVMSATEVMTESGVRTPPVAVMLGLAT